jgi:hypothetical protein
MRINADKQRERLALYPLWQASYWNMKYCARFTAVRGEPETIWRNSTDLNSVLKCPFEERSNCIADYIADCIARSTTKWGIEQVSMHKQLNAVFRKSNVSVVLNKRQKTHVISSFRRELDKNCALLGHYIASSGNFLPTFRDNLSVSFSTVKNRFLALGDWTDRLFRNDCKEIPLLAALHPRKAQFSATNTSYTGAVLQKWQKSELSSAFWGFHRGVIDSPVLWDVKLSIVKSKSTAPEGQSVLGFKPLPGRPPFKACAPRLTDCAVFNAQKKMEL